MLCLQERQKPMQLVTVTCRIGFAGVEMVWDGSDNELVVPEVAEVFIGLLEVLKLLLGEHLVPRLVSLVIVNVFRELGIFLSSKLVENVAVTAVEMVFYVLIE